jgi:hypothetical protein
MDVHHAKLRAPDVAETMTQTDRRGHEAPGPCPDDLLADHELRFSREHVERIQVILVHVRVDALEVGAEAQLDHLVLRALREDPVVPMLAGDLRPAFGPAYPRALSEKCM